MLAQSSVIHKSIRLQSAVCVDADSLHPRVARLSHNSFRTVEAAAQVSLPGYFRGVSSLRE